MRSRGFTKLFGQSWQARPVLNQFSTELRWATLSWELGSKSKAPSNTLPSQNIYSLMSANCNMFLKQLHTKNLKLFKVRNSKSLVTLAYNILEGNAGVIDAIFLWWSFYTILPCRLRRAEATTQSSLLRFINSHLDLDRYGNTFVEDHFVTPNSWAAPPMSSLVFYQTGKRGWQ